MIYLDNSATTQPSKVCVDTMTELLTCAWGNPSSVHALGIDAEKRLKAARAQVAQALGAEPERVFFTSGGTEAVEHHAVLHPMQRLEARGFEVTYLQPDEAGFVSAERLAEALRPDTILVSVMMVNNETGAVMPIPEMIRATRRKSPLALFHTDAVQGFFKLPFKAKTLGADMISVSGHKIHASKGVGALYIRPGLPLPFRRSGTGFPWKAGRAAHRESLPARPPVAGHHQLPSGSRHLRFRRLRLFPRPPQPRSGGDAPPARRHRRLHPRLLLPGKYGGGRRGAA